MKYFLSFTIILICALGVSCMQNNRNTINRGAEPILLVANKHSNSLSFVNPKTFEVIETIPTGPNPHEIAITPDQRFAYLSSYEPPGNTIAVIDLVKRKQIKQINTGEYIRIHGVAIAPDGKNAYFTAGQSGLVVEIDTRTNEIIRAIPTQGKISHMVYVSPDNKTLYTGNIVSGDVSVINRVSGELITLVKTGKGAGGMTFSGNGKYLWVTNETDETISIIDLAVNKVVETIKCAGVIKRIRFTNDERIALITSWTKEGELIVFDVPNRKEIKRLRVGDFAIGIELSPDNKYAFVGCEDSKNTKVLADGAEELQLKTEGSDGIHVIDMQKLEVSSVIKTGLGPDPMAIWFPPKK